MGCGESLSFVVPSGTRPSLIARDSPLSSGWVLARADILESSVDRANPGCDLGDPAYEGQSGDPKRQDGECCDPGCRKDGNPYPRFAVDAPRWARLRLAGRKERGAGTSRWLATGIRTAATEWTRHLKRGCRHGTRLARLTVLSAQNWIRGPHVRCGGSHRSATHILARWPTAPSVQHPGFPAKGKHTWLVVALGMGDPSPSLRFEIIPKNRSGTE